MNGVNRDAVQRADAGYGIVRSALQQRASAIAMGFVP